MGASKHDIFGDTPGAQPAVPGSYGEAPEGFRLPESTALGRVKLQVADLGRSLAFYEHTLGLRPIDRTANYAALGPHDHDSILVELHERAGAKPAPRRGRLGLYHFAILLPDRPSLGRFIDHLGRTDARVGSSDHLVSEALYLQDPDNLGIEVYTDRPRSTWKRAGRQLMMATDPLDVAGLLAAAEGKSWTGMPAGTTMGHVHLHVGDIDRASSFFSRAMGFDRMVWQYPGALFLAAGGYHHHLGTNIWAGPDAAVAAPDEARLLEWTVRLPDSAAVEAVSENLRSSGFDAKVDGAGNNGSVVARDPWGTQLRVTI